MSYELMSLKKVFFVKMILFNRAMYYHIVFALVSSKTKQSAFASSEKFSVGYFVIIYISLEKGIKTSGICMN